LLLYNYLLKFIFWLFLFLNSKINFFIHTQTKTNHFLFSFYKKYLPNHKKLFLKKKKKKKIENKKYFLI
jgi:hypothetical protein